MDGRAQTVESKTSIVGAWTLNKDLSDQVGNGDQSSSSGEQWIQSQRWPAADTEGAVVVAAATAAEAWAAAAVATASQATDPDQAARMRDAMRDLTGPSDHLTITQTDSLVVITGADGRTTRLSPDGKKIKDDNTKVERKTKWDGDKLVSEINGLGTGKGDADVRRRSGDPSAAYRRPDGQRAAVSRARSRTSTTSTRDSVGSGLFLVDLVGRLAGRDIVDLRQRFVGRVDIVEAEGAAGVLQRNRSARLVLAFFPLPFALPPR